MEYIDLYSREGELLRRHVPKKTERTPEEYYRHVHVILFDERGYCLMQQRSLTAKYLPGKWDVTGGGVQSGESTLDAAIREVREELGLELPAEKLQLGGFRVDEAAGRGLLDVYCVRFHFRESDCRIRREEVEAVKFVPYDEFIETVCYNKDEVYRGILENIRGLIHPEKSYADVNAETIAGWIREGWEWGKPIDHETCEKARTGEWSVLLTPNIPVPMDWFGEMKGKKLLGLASGGGQQVPLFAIAGAECTVLDYCPEQLEGDRMVAEREGLSIELVRADMTKPLPFADESFDIIFHPVSNCYIEDVQHVWNECFRVLKPGGRLLAGLDNGLNYAFDDEEPVVKYRLPFNPLKDPEQMVRLNPAEDGIQFSHTIEEQIGGQLKAGFLLKDLYSDTENFGWSKELNFPGYWATLAVKQ
ncbi:MAG: methyltransferase domain-containing protein [Oscillospiraceae bacterium]|nr:methyltransferase domain-containing protein [Oscillospiraceae bacterium]